METDPRPLFQLGEQVRFSERYQAAIDREDAIYTCINMLREQKPGMTHITFKTELAENQVHMISLQGVERMFERRNLSLRLAGLDQGLDLGHDQFLRQCVMDNQPIQHSDEPT